MHPIHTAVLALALLAPPAAAQDESPSLQDASRGVQQQLQESLAELSALREAIKDEKLPLGRRLGELEAELSAVRKQYQQTSRLLEGRALDLSNLGRDLEARRGEVAYLSNLLGEFVRNVESRLHVAEVQRYDEPLAAARLAPENGQLGPGEVFAAQTPVLTLALDRLEEALGGTRFAGTAVDPSGFVERGTFVVVGPAALFRSDDGEDVGTAEQRLGSLEPAVIPFADPADRAAADALVARGEGLFPLDPTLGHAHKIAATQETLWEHVQKGGPVMVPIGVLAGAALLVALWKWLALVSTRKPSQKQIDALLAAVGRQDEAALRERAAALKGPTGRMLQVGVEHLSEPRELIEEVMFEKVLQARLQLERLLPFVSICAASAPLLGLLGTVTGIINTFKLITVFGSGDVKTLSGGISEALITTEYGLIVAIPSLLLHAFLSRKAKGIVSQMETAAVAFANQASRTPAVQPDRSAGNPDPDAGHGRARAPAGSPLDELLAGASS